MSLFDEEPDGDPHGECAAEIGSLQAEIKRLNDALTQPVRVMGEMQIRQIAFTAGFIPKWVRPGFGPDLHDYVFTFARAVADAAVAAYIAQQKEPK